MTTDGWAPNPHFTPPAEYVSALPVPAEPLEDTPPRLAALDVTDFIGLRHAVAAELATVDAPRDPIEDYLLAVDEMSSNAARHGRPPISLRLWTAPDRIVCTIADRGPGWDDPFAGYGPAHGEDLSRGGMGLWLARQLCDHVDITTDAEGTRVRLTLRLGLTAGSAEQVAQEGLLLARPVAGVLLTVAAVLLAAHLLEHLADDGAEAPAGRVLVLPVPVLRAVLRPMLRPVAGLLPAVVVVPSSRRRARRSPRRSAGPAPPGRGRSRGTPRTGRRGPRCARRCAWSRGTSDRSAPCRGNDAGRRVVPGLLPPSGPRT